MCDSFFTVGQKFQTFQDLETAITEYEKRTLCKVYKMDSRKIDTRRVSIVEKVNPELIYYEITYACIKGGKKFRTRSKGIRPIKPRKDRKDCPMYISIRLDRERQALEVRGISEEHNHNQLSEEELEKLQSKDERRKQLMIQKNDMLNEFRDPVPISSLRERRSPPFLREIKPKRDQKDPIIHTFLSIQPVESSYECKKETVSDVDDSLSEPVNYLINSLSEPVNDLNNSPNELMNDSSNFEDLSNIQTSDSPGVSGDTSSTKRKRTDFEIAVIEELKRTNDIILKRQKTPNELFGEIVASKLDKLSDSACSDARIKILQTLHDVEFGTNNGMNNFQIVKLF